MILTHIKRNKKLKLEVPIDRTCVMRIMRASCDRIDIDTQKVKLWDFRITHVCIMRASYDSIDNKLKQEMCG